MKVLALIIVLAGLVIAIVPQATNCEAQGGTMPSASTGGAATAAAWDVTAPAAGTAFASAQTTTVDTIVPKMKCLWSARGGLVVGITLAVVGGLLFFARRKETRRALSIIAAVLGLFTILLPTSLIGTCGSSAAVCNTTMKPLMLVAGGIALIAGLAAVVVNELKRDVTVEALAD